LFVRSEEEFILFTFPSKEGNHGDYFSFKKMLTNRFSATVAIIIMIIMLCQTVKPLELCKRNIPELHGKGILREKGSKRGCYSTNGSCIPIEFALVAFHTKQNSSVFSSRKRKCCESTSAKRIKLFVVRGLSYVLKKIAGFE
jgi:hypothetical protein